MLYGLCLLGQEPQRLWRKAKIHPKGDYQTLSWLSSGSKRGTFHLPGVLDSLLYPVIMVSTSSCGLNKILKQAWKEKISTKDLISVMTIRSDGYILSYYCPYFDPAHIEFHLRQWPIFKIKESESISRCI